MGLEQLGTGRGRMTTTTHDADMIRDRVAVDTEFRRRLRELVVKYAPPPLRDPLCGFVDRAPTSVLLTFRDSVRELVK